jgi:hypothetical protein
MNADQRRTWLCFRNSDEAASMLGDLRAPARVRVTIDEFLSHNSFSDGYNTAKLISVSKLQER